MKRALHERTRPTITASRTDGSVTNARVLRATPSRVFDREAMNAVKRWRFEPVSAPVTTRRTLVFAPGGS